jgi:hypothetical protein
MNRRPLETCTQCATPAPQRIAVCQTVVISEKYEDRLPLFTTGIKPSVSVTLDNFGKREVSLCFELPSCSVLKRVRIQG